MEPIALTSLDTNRHIADYANEMLMAIRREEKDLVDRAKALAAEHLAKRKSRVGMSSWTEKGGSLVLMVRDRTAGNRYIRFEWAILTPHKTNSGKWTTTYKALPKGTGFKYRDVTLMQHARDWERDSILAIEVSISEYRKAIRKAVLARKAIKQFVNELGMGPFIEEEL